MQKINAPVIIAHVVGSLIFLSSPLLLLSRWTEGQPIFSLLFSTSYLVFCITFLSVFYINAYLLIPFFYLQKKFIAYFLIVVFMLMVVYAIRPFDQLLSNSGPAFHNNSINPAQAPLANNPIPSPERTVMGAYDPNTVFFFIMAIVMGLAIRTTSQLMVTEQRAANAEADKANAELSFLKAQINPHFLFNSLNSIYALAIRKDERTSDAVVQLSELMRYIMKEANYDLVELEKEINYINNYIELQKSRLGDTVIINQQFRGNMEGLKIAPLILSSFIENAFKYGVNPDKNSKIEVIINIVDAKIRLYVFNRKTNVPKHSKGIGLQNTKKRLEMIYPERHDLLIKEEEDSYTVHLLINLHDQSDRIG